MEYSKIRSVTSFISSANRQEQEAVHNFTIDYPDNILSCNGNEFMELNVLSFDMPNTMYNINYYNNSFEYIVNDIVYVKTIIPGNYNIKTFMKQLQTLINNQDITISYNDAQNTYTFIKNTTDSNTYQFKPINIGRLVGLNDGEVYTISESGFDTGLINLVNYNKVIVETENINYYYNNINNLAEKEGSKQLFSNIIFWKSKADTEPFQILKYNNEDGGSSFVYKVMNRQINSVGFKLKNERGEEITDAQDYLMVIQFNFYKMHEKDNNNILMSIDTTLKEIYNTILFALNRLKLLI